MEGLLLLGLAVVWLLGTIFVVTDASANSSQSTILWGVVAFFGGLLGIALYGLLGRDATGESEGRSRSGGRKRRSLSHVCQDCGEEYFANSGTDIDACRNCDGIRVEAI